MICIAAFIILAIVSVFVAFLSIFKKDIGKKWWKVFKKAWHCVFKKVRLQKCDTNFKDDVKNTLLKHVILKHPKWVKPLSILIEVISVVIVAVVVWAIATALKSLLALWALGTCNVTQPSQCGLGAESCTIDAQEPTTFGGKFVRWFTEWGDIAAAVPDKFRDWTADSYLNDGAISVNKNGSKKAIDIMDPGCTVCLTSFRNQKEAGFFDDYDVYLVIYPIRLPDGTDKFPNSTLVAKYIYATQVLAKEKAEEKDQINKWSSKSINYDDIKNTAAIKIIGRIYTEKDKNGTIYQTTVQKSSEADALKLLDAWAAEFGLTKAEIGRVHSLMDGDTVKSILEQNRQLVEEKVHARGIPIEIYDGSVHNGLYKIK